MSTTYAKIQTSLRQASRNKEWIDINTLAKEIRKRRLRDFRIRDDGSSIDHYMKEGTICKHLELMVSLELLKKNSDNRITVTSKGRGSIISEDRFNRQIRSSVKSLFESKNLNIQLIKATVEKIKLPDVPDAGTLFDRLNKHDHGFDENLLRKLLFLYACAKGVGRRVRVHYEFN